MISAEHSSNDGENEVTKKKLANDMALVIF